MKILLTTMALDLGGAETHIVELGKELAARGNTVIAASNGGQYVSKFESAGVRHFNIPMHSRSPALLLKSAIKLFSTVRRERPDIVHSHARIPAMISGLICAIFRIPMVTTVHAKFEVNGLLRHLSNWGKKSLAVSNDLKNYLVDEYSVPADSIYMTVNGIDTERFSANDTHRADIRSEFNIQPDAFVITHVSRLDDEHFDASYDARLLIKIAGSLYKENSHILIVGDGANFNELSEQARKVNESLGVNYIIMCGARLDVHRILSASDLFIGLSRAAMEALSVGLPVVLAGASGYFGYVNESNIDKCAATNFTCRGSEPPTENDLITVLSNIPQVRFDGRKYIKSNYSVSYMTDTTYKAYESALRKRYGAAICGAYGMGNVGDEAILEAVISDIKEIDPFIPIWVFSKRPKVTASRHGIRSAHTFNVFSFFRIMGRVNIYINGGGNLIQDDTSRRSLLFYLYTLYTAKLRHTPVIMYGCGIGPINYRFDRWLAGKIINSCVDVITLRENQSIEELKQLCVTKPDIRLSADPVLSLAPADAETIDAEMSALGLDPQGRYICFALRPWKGLDGEKIAEISKTADYMRDKYGLTPIFLPINGKIDTEPNKTAAEKCRGILIREIPEPRVAIGVIGRMTCVVSMRLHGLIFGAVSHVPLTGIAYEPKVSQFLDYINQPHCVDLSDISKLTETIETALRNTNTAMSQARENERVNINTLRECFRDKTQ